MDDEKIYRGFDLTKEQEAQSEDWLRQRFGDKVQDRIDRSKAVGASWSPEEMEAYLREGREFDAALARAVKQGLPASSETVQALVRDHCATVCRGWGVPPERGACLALSEIYRDMPQFRERFEVIAPDAPQYVSEAIRLYAEGQPA